MRKKEDQNMAKFLRATRIKLHDGSFKELADPIKIIDEL